MNCEQSVLYLSHEYIQAIIISLFLFFTTKNYVGENAAEFSELGTRHFFLTTYQRHCIMLFYPTCTMHHHSPQCLYSTFIQAWCFVSWIIISQIARIYFSSFNAAPSHPSLRSTSTPPRGGQPPPLLAVNLHHLWKSTSTLRCGQPTSLLVVIFHSLWLSTSTLRGSQPPSLVAVPFHLSWQSTSISSGS